MDSGKTQRFNNTELTHKSFARLYGSIYVNNAGLFLLLFVPGASFDSDSKLENKSHLIQESNP